MAFLKDNITRGISNSMSDCFNEEVRFYLLLEISCINLVSGRMPTRTEYNLVIIVMVLVIYAIEINTYVFFGEGYGIRNNSHAGYKIENATPS